MLLSLHPRSLIRFAALRRVLQLRAVTQCAMLEEFGIFLVLADKVRSKPWGSIHSDTPSQALFAYHIEALVPSSPHAAASNHVPQKLNGTKDVHFFSVGTLQGRTLVAYMKKKGVRLFHPSFILCVDVCFSLTVFSECSSQ